MSYIDTYTYLSFNEILAEDEREAAAIPSVTVNTTRTTTTRRETGGGTATPRASCGRTSVAPCPRHPSMSERSLSISLSRVRGIVTLAPRTRDVQGRASSRESPGILDDNVNKSCIYLPAKRN